MFLTIFNKNYQICIYFYFIVYLIPPNIDILHSLPPPPHFLSYQILTLLFTFETSKWENSRNDDIKNVITKIISFVISPLIRCFLFRYYNSNLAVLYKMQSLFLLNRLITALKARILVYMQTVFRQTDWKTGIDFVLQVYQQARWIRFCLLNITVIICYYVSYYTDTLLCENAHRTIKLVVSKSVTAYRLLLILKKWYCNRERLVTLGQFYGHRFEILSSL